MDITKKVRDVAVEMMKEVKLDEDHNYTRVSDGKWLAGVSTIAGVTPKEWLAAWGAKECSKFLGYSDYEGDTVKADEMRAKIGKMSTDEYLELLTEAKGACRRKSKDALLDGKEGHAWLEDYVKAKMRGTKAPNMPKDEKLNRPLKLFVEWEQKAVKEWVLSEARVADVENEFAGTLDAVAVLKDGRLAIIDYKFASHVSDDYYLQTAGYAIPFEKYGIKFDCRIIVRLPKTETKDVYNKKTRQYEKEENGIEIHEVPTDYEFDKKTFLAARTVWKWINHLKK